MSIWKLVPAFNFGLSKIKDPELDDLVLVPNTNDEMETMAIALVYRDNDVDLINANLLAAAPEMLEALKLSVRKDGCACDKEPVDGHPLYVCYKHQAIGRAEAQVKNGYNLRRNKELRRL